jgi:integrase
VLVWEGWVSGQPKEGLGMSEISGYAARRANVPTGVHILRHSFCSHLAMRGAAGKAIQELAGHQDLTTTQRYMHLSPAARESAIRLLEQPMPEPPRGDILETEKAANAS